MFVYHLDLATGKIFFTPITHKLLKTSLITYFEIPKHKLKANQVLYDILLFLNKPVFKARIINKVSPPIWFLTNQPFL